MIALVAPLRVAAATLGAVVLPAVISAVLLGSVLLGAVVVASPAGADGRAGSGVELSGDRVTWGGDLDAPLFPPGLAWAAGDVRAATFFVRNDSGATADIEVTLTRSPPADPAPGPVTDPATGADVVVTAVATTDTSLPADGEPHVVTVEALAPGDVAPVTLRAEVPAAVPSGTAVDPGTIDYRAALAGTSDDKPDTAPDVAADPEDDPAGILSAAHLALAPVFLGFALVLATVVGRRRTRSRRRGR